MKVGLDSDKHKNNIGNNGKGILVIEGIPVNLLISMDY